MAELTFRDFAGAIMQGDTARASTVLQELLGLPPEQAAASTAVFAAKMKDPAFMPKAMGLRAAVTSGLDDEVAALLGECFGLEGDVRSSAVAAVRARYPARNG
jgi:hypothetical protein